MKKKRRGHYCKVCGEHKANEKFTGKGHARHICKSCAKATKGQKKEIIEKTEVADEFLTSDFFLELDCCCIFASNRKKYFHNKIKYNALLLSS
jgi:hypothetical protein